MYKTLPVLVVVVLLVLLAAAAMASSPTSAPLTSAAMKAVADEDLQAPNTGPPRTMAVVAEPACATTECVAMGITRDPTTLAGMTTPTAASRGSTTTWNITDATLAALRGSPEGTSFATRTGNTYTANAVEAYAASPPRHAVVCAMRAEGRRLTLS